MGWAWDPKTVKKIFFTKFGDINAPQQCIPCAILGKGRGFWAFLWPINVLNLVGFAVGVLKLRGSEMWFPQNFQHPLAAKLSQIPKSQRSAEMVGPAAVSPR